jgi:hypothetical protein
MTACHDHEPASHVETGLRFVVPFKSRVQWQVWVVSCWINYRGMMLTTSLLCVCLECVELYFHASWYGICALWQLNLTLLNVTALHVHLPKWMNPDSWVRNMMDFVLCGRGSNPGINTSVFLSTLPEWSSGSRSRVSSMRCRFCPWGKAAGVWSFTYVWEVVQPIGCWCICK